MGAGTALNTIDSFLLADKMVLVTTPEITSIENLYIFVKKIIVRKIKDMLDYEGFKEIDKSIILDIPKGEDSIKFTEFLEKLKGLGKEQEKIVSQGLESLTVNLVLNQIREKKYAQYGISLKSVLKRHFNIDALFSGYIEYNESILKLVSGDSDIETVMIDKKISESVNFITKNISSGSDVNFNELK